MIAIIDIGSNSVRLMLWADGKTIFKRILTTRLGAGVENRCLAKPAMVRSAEAVSYFYHEAVKAGAEKVFAFATAAVRSAQNKDEFLRLVKETAGLNVDVVSGEEEARLAALGALGRGDGIVVDVGGASSEVICVRNGETVFAKSFPIGAVTLTEKSKDNGQNAERCVHEIFGALPCMAGKVYAVGGTATQLACLMLELREYDAERVHGYFIAKDALSGLKEKLFSLTVGERKKLIGMEESRADVIACGACILSEITKKLGADGICVSDCDNLEGYLYARGLV
ncbi:MAG: hypothetical protein K2L02_00965 [Clostridia bacterium]|nr:hypothetical protein [Clostridia bacterium]